MATTTKKLKAAESIYDREKDYSVEEAFGILKKLPNAKFDESVDMSLRLGVDPKHADQMVRGAIVLPHGIGKAVRVAVFAKGEKERAAREVKAGKVEFRVDKAGNVHVPVGKKSFAEPHLVANTLALLEAIVRAKPSAAKGQYLRSVTVSSTMGPGIHLDVQRVANLFKKVL